MMKWNPQRTCRSWERGCGACRCQRCRLAPTWRLLESVLRHVVCSSWFFDGSRPSWTPNLAKICTERLNRGFEMCFNGVTPWQKRKDKATGQAIIHRIVWWVSTLHIPSSLIRHKQQMWVMQVIQFSFPLWNEAKRLWNSVRLLRFANTASCCFSVRFVIWRLDHQHAF